MSREARLTVWLAVLAGSALILYQLAPVLTPFLFSALLAYLGDPIVDRIEVRFPKLSRTWAVFIVFLAIFLTLLILTLFWLPRFIRQINSLIDNLPAFLDWLQTAVIPWLQAHLGLDPAQLDLASVRAALSGHIDRLGNIAGGVLTAVSKSSLVALGWLANLFLIPVVTFYLLRDWDILVARVRDLLPRRIEPVISKLAQEADEVLGVFLLGQFIVMLILGGIYSLGLYLIGLNLALLIGMLAGMVSFVPYMGLVVGMLVAGIAALVQFQEITALVPVLIVFGVGQLIEGFVLTPVLVGDRIGLHPVAVIFAVLAGGHLFGFFGILLALPVAAVIMVLLRHTHDEYLKSVLYDH